MSFKEPIMKILLFLLLISTNLLAQDAAPTCVSPFTVYFGSDNDIVVKGTLENGRYNSELKDLNGVVSLSALYLSIVNKEPTSSPTLKVSDLDKKNFQMSLNRAKSRIAERRALPNQPEELQAILNKFEQDVSALDSYVKTLTTSPKRADFMTKIGTFLNTSVAHEAYPAHVVVNNGSDVRDRNFYYGFCKNICMNSIIRTDIPCYFGNVASQSNLCQKDFLHPVSTAGVGQSVCQMKINIEQGSGNDQNLPSDNYTPGRTRGATPL
jgi:hypothetical protein